MMKKTVQSALPAYEQVCLMCIDDWYRAACFVLASREEAEKLVTKLCVSGVHRYGELSDPAKIRSCLVSDLYDSLKRRLRVSAPDPRGLPEKLRRFTGAERLALAMRLYGEETKE